MKYITNLPLTDHSIKLMLDSFSAKLLWNNVYCEEQYK